MGAEMSENRPENMQNDREIMQDDRLNFDVRRVIFDVQRALSECIRPGVGIGPRIPGPGGRMTLRAGEPGIDRVAGSVIMFVLCS